MSSISTAIEWTDKTWNPSVPMNEDVTVYTEGEPVVPVEAMIRVLGERQDVVRAQVASPIIATGLTYIAVSSEDGGTPINVFRRVAQHRVERRDASLPVRITLTARGGLNRALAQVSKLFGSKRFPLPVLVSLSCFAHLLARLDAMRTALKGNTV